MNERARMMADRHPVPGWVGMPDGSYSVESGFGAAWVDPSGDEYVFVDPNGRRVRVRKAAPEPVVEPAPVDPRELLYREPRTFEEFQTRMRLVELEVLAGRRAAPAPRPPVDERPATVEDDPAWQAFQKAAQAWLASEEYARQRDETAASFDRATAAERARLERVAASDTDPRRAVQAARDLENLERIVRGRAGIVEDRAAPGAGR